MKPVKCATGDCKTYSSSPPPPPPSKQPTTIHISLAQIQLPRTITIIISTVKRKAALCNLSKGSTLSQVSTELFFHEGRKGREEKKRRKRETEYNQHFSVLSSSEENYWIRNLAFQYHTACTSSAYGFHFD